QALAAGTLLHRGLERGVVGVHHRADAATGQLLDLELVAAAAVEQHQARLRAFQPGQLEVERQRLAVDGELAAPQALGGRDRAGQRMRGAQRQQPGQSVAEDGAVCMPHVGSRGGGRFRRLASVDALRWRSWTVGSARRRNPEANTPELMTIAPKEMSGGLRCMATADPASRSWPNGRPR